MNSIHLSGTIADRPSPIYDGTTTRFFLRARHPPVTLGFPPGMVDVPCRVCDASPEQRKILLGGKHKNVRVEVAGRLEQIVSKGSNSRKNGRKNSRQRSNLEMIVNRQGLFLQRVR
jgi:hypothetical protein